MNANLFVYGTLRNDSRHGMYRLLARGSTFLGEATARGRLFDLGEYPGAIPSDGTEDLVHGEVYCLDIPDEVLRELDSYEGCGADDPEPHEFERESTLVELRNGEQVRAWIYWYRGTPDPATQIHSGDYLNR